MFKALIALIIMWGLAILISHSYQKAKTMDPPPTKATKIFCGSFMLTAMAFTVIFVAVIFIKFIRETLF